MMAMESWLGTMIGVGAAVVFTMPAVAQSQPLFLAYPPQNHQTSSPTIFFIGSAAPNVTVTLNGQPIERSAQGNFAPVIPLKMGENQFVFQAESQRIERTITRIGTGPTLSPQGGFAAGSLTPAVPISRPAGEPICFTAIAPTDAMATVTLAGQTIPLTPQGNVVQLPPNNTILHGENQPQVTAADQYKGCQSFNVTNLPAQLGTPQFNLQWRGQNFSTPGPGSVTLLNGDRPQVIVVTSQTGVARTGPGTDYSRLTPLPQGSQASVTGQDGDWLRLDYGGWIKADETRTLPSQAPPRSLIRSVGYQVFGDRTEMRFPLQLPVPVTVHQTEMGLTLSLYNTTAQTDTIRLDNDPIIRNLTWQQISPDRIDYYFTFKTDQQWGYDLRYEGTTLILSLRHPPRISSQPGNLQGVKILLDPGHGGSEAGAVGPTGYAEKDINLLISQRLANRLKSQGANVHLTRTRDEFVSLVDRQTQIAQVQPAIALSIHYNALPDSGNPNETDGISTFWYNAQAADLANFLQRYLVENLGRNSHGVYWNNLALTRPTIAPAVLLELGFMISPQEFEWITNAQAQEQLVQALATGITTWLQQQR
ncbi:N-acetylmuramoyl-L-alanine amidase [Synechocystis sp. PCC 6803]|uniref:N-acetylmuramoyl-L-alanine amidase n=3 Tax=unclassified Synechocystis TaxID=2640012 RepID=P73581_SYNY3|nr:MULTISPECIES: N-acetylmuramoyl-L-alanine amidase [unclassified Synechocystis]MBD2660246.1 N-acetylmuramoyl-L-alanine amidase [Synechocystis sp. FACHB-929]AGF51310.1 N-acetylmuramoyl-L-alanine amidase [Synechocystis sp. PCC 6803]AVP91258.1 N-acetylmuramoyl-L-alanine amidase [Synechocystis sp. IPPAS B-1465]MBD2617640.1 N-acetylmuramoyl-L-alanine amidase [Synechocystis sp. FACHB-898]MBD2638999.1 N-acetylmuramoyl-L-alanine amidase [Synechocystis sp. FACHB-908]